MCWLRPDIAVDWAGGKVRVMCDVCPRCKYYCKVLLK